MPTPPRMHEDDVETDASLVRRLLEEQFPELADLTVAHVDLVGTDNSLYRLGEELVVRLPRRERPSLTLEKECRWLPRLAPLLPVAVPTPVVRGRPGEGYPFPWAVYTWLPGERAATSEIGNGELFAADLAAFVAALREIDTAGGPLPGPHNFFRGVTLAERDAATRAALGSLEGGIDVGRVTTAWEEALQAPEWQRPPTWIHGDLDAQNLLVADGRLSGVIDFGGLGIGDPACDVMVGWKVLSRDARDAFRAALAVDDATWARSRGWAISQAAVALSSYSPDTHPVLVREARRWLEEALAF